MKSQPHQPARKVGKRVTEKDLQPGATSYPDIPTDEPGLVGGPATEAVPGSHAVTDDGGETTLSGRPRETGGERPRKTK